MSANKEIFLKLCKDAVTQHNAGVDNPTIKQNITYLAEVSGIPFLSAITIGDTMGHALNNISKTEETVTMDTLAKEFLSLSLKK